MKHAGTLVLPLIFLSTAWEAPAPGADADPLSPAWEAWRRGNIVQAEEQALRAVDQSPMNAAHHLLALTSFVQGNHGKGLEHFERINPASPIRKKLNGPVLDALCHLDRYREAAAFAQTSKMPDFLCDHLKRRAENPTKTSLASLCVVPFVKVPLSDSSPGNEGDKSDYFPGFEIELEGKPVTAHMDTGGPYLVMGPAEAAALGIEAHPGGEGNISGQAVPLSYGISKKMRIGKALLENIPVVISPNTKGIIFGTNVLQRFYATMDYPNKRLILSPRGNEPLQREHDALLPLEKVEIPFYLWGDHYMFARGGVGTHQNLTFFVDSGLVHLSDFGDGRGLRQAAFAWAHPEDYQRWGIPAECASKPVFESPLPLSLGPLCQDGHLFVTNKNQKKTDFGGIAIDGLISHAFLKKYAWTIDFDRHRYVFSTPEKK